MSYQRKSGRASRPFRVSTRAPLMGLSGVENCGADQVYDPNIEAFGIKGQCMPRANYRADQLVNPNAFPGTVKTSGSSASSIGTSVGAILSALFQPKPTAPTQVVYPTPSGISTTTLLVGGAALLGLVYFATKD